MGYSIRAAAGSVGLTVALSILCLGTVGTADADEETPDTGYGRRRAVCVGINEYTTHPKLKCPVGDAMAMAQTLESYGFDEVVVLTDAKATRGAILSVLERLKSEATDEDLFVFFFAGHGVTVQQQGSSEGYLVPSGCRAGREGKDGISMEVIRDLAASMPTRHSLFLVDACHSGYGLNTEIKITKSRRRRSKEPVLDVDAALGSRSVQILSAGGTSDWAFESDGHGLFTRHVLRCLRGETPEAGDGFVSGSELAARVKRMVLRETGGWQCPKFGHDGQGDVVFELAQFREGRAGEVAMAAMP